MTAARRIPPAPVGQQAPPTRAAASDSGRSLRVARGSLLLTTGTGYRHDKPQEDQIQQDAPTRRINPMLDQARKH